jgi:hypothetical protein
MRYNSAMKDTEIVKRTSVYISLELVDKVQQSAKIHRRSFNQELLWLAEQGLASQEKTPDKVAALSGAVKALSL